VRLRTGHGVYLLLRQDFWFAQPGLVARKRRWLVAKSQESTSLRILRQVLNFPVSELRFLLMCLNNWYNYVMSKGSRLTVLESIELVCVSASPIVLRKWFWKIGYYFIIFTSWVWEWSCACVRLIITLFTWNFRHKHDWSQSSKNASSTPWHFHSFKPTRNRSKHTNQDNLKQEKMKVTLNPASQKSDIHHCNYTTTASNTSRFKRPETHRNTEQNFNMSITRWREFGKDSNTNIDERKNTPHEWPDS
jgi:hypothetical protein